jgi:RND family efflux transporter MFP subunit
VSVRLAENHEMVVAGVMVLQYHDVEWLEVTVNVPENEMIRRAPERGAPARVSFTAAPGRMYAAELKEWSSASDKMTRTYAVTFRFKAPEDIKVLPGMSSEVVWSDESAAAAQLRIPVSALVPDADGRSFVWIYNDLGKTAEKRAVQTGPLSGASRITVLQGLKEGDVVVVSGSRLIREGQTLAATSL